jgi:hypothetical protein
MENANASLAGLRRVTDEIAAAQLAECCARCGRIPGGVS